ncbi:MAG: VWA domain-containing protein [Candidatus Acidiferrales bacterium]
MKIAELVSIAGLSVFFLTLADSSHIVRAQESQSGDRQSGQESQVTVPNRSAGPLYKGEQGTQKSDVMFAPLSRTVTIKFQVQDPNGYFLPNIRRDNFAVYEDGVRQRDISVDVEHAPITVALLLEYGGRYHELNQSTGREVVEIARLFMDRLRNDDKVGIFTYSDKLQTLADFNQGRDADEKALDSLGTPLESELNFYDALLATIERMKNISGRKAIIAISSGLDTFSKASYQQMVQAAQESETTIYTIGLIRLIQRDVAVYGSAAPFARIDWNSAEQQLEALAKASGGRAYVPDSDLEVPAIYDDLMENLRVRYVIKYVSSNTATVGPPRNIRVELIDPNTGGPLKIHDANGKIVAAKVYLQASYTPKSATGD